MTEPISTGRSGGGAAERTRRGGARAGVRRRRDGEAVGRMALPLASVALVCETVQGQLKCAGGRHVAAARARDARRGVARSLRASAHRARAPIRGQAPAGGRSRARVRRAGDRDVAGAVGAVFDLPEAAARGRCRAAGRQAEAAAARALRRQAAVLVHGLARRVVPGALWQEIHAYYRLAEMLECAVYGGLRRSRAATPSACRAIRRTVMRCCLRSPIRAR